MVKWSRSRRVNPKYKANPRRGNCYAVTYATNRISAMNKLKRMMQTREVGVRITGVRKPAARWKPRKRSKPFEVIYTEFSK